MKLNYLTATLLVVGLAACTNEEESPVLNDTPIAARITANIGNEVMTRVSGSAWDTNDKIGISYTSTDENKSGTNIAYHATTTTGDFEPDGEPIYLEGDDTYTFTAYYPYSETVNEENKSISATTEAANQSSNIDFLYASGATAIKANPSVNFTFKHCMSRLTLTFAKGDGLDDAAMSEYTLSGIKLSGTFDTTTGTATATTEETASSLTMTATFGNTSSVFLFPQELSGITVRITIGGETYSATLKLPDEATALAAGKNYTYNITVTKVGLLIDKANITEWSESDGSEASATI